MSEETVHIIVASVIGFLCIWFLSWVHKKDKEFREIRKKRFDFINTYILPQKISDQLKEKYPDLTEEHIISVRIALKDYFHAFNLLSGDKLAMPSKVVDFAWHEFILFTREYDDFCQKAFGKFLHHTPSQSSKTRSSVNEDVQNTWKICCTINNIDHKNPSKLPLLFGIDSLLNIEDGFKYDLKNIKDDAASGSGCGVSSCSSSDSDGCGGD
jgi:hypothetical protein